MSKLNQIELMNKSDLNFEISIRDFRLLSLIFKNQALKTLLVRKIDTRELLHMRIIKKKDSSSSAFQRIKPEISHPFIISVKHTFENYKRKYVLYEHYQSCKSLLNQQRLDEDTIKFYAACVLSALSYYHQNSVVYLQ